MANPRKKIINQWDGGVKSHPRDNNPDTTDGAQLVKGFDIFKDPRKLSPMQSWESFTTTDEKAYGIRAMGGTGSTVYGAGKALIGWYGSNWAHRIKVNVAQQYHTAMMPLWLDMSRLPADFWSHVNADMSDVRITGADGTTAYGVFTENVDMNAMTGDMWIEQGAVSQGTVVTTKVDDFTGTGSAHVEDNSSAYGYAIPITLSGQTFNAVKINLLKDATAVASSNLVCSLYTNNAGSPGTLVTELGQIDIDRIDSITRDYIIACTPQTLTGYYWLVFYVPGSLTSGSVRYTFSSSGTTNLKQPTNAGLTVWTDIDTSATPNYELLNIVDQSQPTKYFYIYYGYASATAVPYGTPGFDYTDGARSIFSANNTRWDYTFGNDGVGNRYYSQNETITGTENFETLPQIYTAGLFGRAIQTYGMNVDTDNDDDVGLSGGDVSFSFLVKITAGASVTLYSSASGYWSIALDTNRKILFSIDGSLGNATKTSTIALSVDQWHVIDCVFDGNYYIYIDGVKETFTDADGNYDGDPNGDVVRVNTGYVATIGQLIAYDNDLTDDQIATKFQNFTNPYFYTSIGSEEDLADIEKNYDGFQLYYKTISSGDWKEYLEAGRPVRSFGIYPLNSFIADNGTYFVTASNEENTGFMYLSMVDNLTVLDASHLLLTTGTTLNNTHLAVQSEAAMDLKTYFLYGSTSLGEVGDPGDASAFTNSTTIQTIGSWRDFLALGGTRRNRGYIDIWDLAITQATEKIDVGTGTVRVVGSAGDTLFCVVDNFIDDAVKSANKPTMEIKQYVGNGRMETTHILEIPTNIATTTYSDTWDFAVSNMKIQRNTQILFYARLPKDSTGTTFNEGLWTVGKNTRGQLALTLQIDTEGLGMPENIFAFAQQVFFIQKDGGIKRLSEDTYDNVALYTTLKMNEGNTQIEKKLIGIEIVTEPLEAGQTVSVYFKKNGDTSRTKIFDMTGENEITYETTYDINEDNLPIYKEIEFDIESTGGTASILELNYRYEYLSEIV